MKPGAILFYFAILTVYLAVSVAGWAGGSKEGAKMEGQYGLTSNPDTPELTKYRTVMGFSEEIQAKLKSKKKILVVVRHVNATHCEIKSFTKKDSWGNIFQSGVEFQGMLVDGRKSMMSFTSDKEKMTIRKVIKMEGFESVHDYTFCKMGMNITMKAKDAVATVTYKRLMLKAAMDKDEEMRMEYFGAEMMMG